MNTVNSEEVGIKLERTNCRHPQLFYEAKVYKTLVGGVGIPYVRWYGVEGEYNIMVMDLLGPSLEDLFNYCGRKFSLKTVLMLADQMIRRLEYIHTKHFIHRDIKPDNFLMGLERRGNQVFLIDFGLAKRFREPKTFTHMQYRDQKHLTGTARYASIHAHLGIEQSRRDDLESLGYVLMYFINGQLPWQGLRAPNKKMKYDKISEKKIEVPTEELCKGYPEEFAQYFKYIKDLQFDDKPDYAMLRKSFRDLFIQKGYKSDYEYDWVVLKKQAEMKNSDDEPKNTFDPSTSKGTNYTEFETGQNTTNTGSLRVKNPKGQTSSFLKIGKTSTTPPKSPEPQKNNTKPSGGFGFTSLFTKDKREGKKG